MGMGTSEEQIRALETEAQHLQRMLESAPDYITRISTSGRLLYLNRAAPGYRLEEALGRLVDDYLPPEFVERAHVAIRAACETRTVQQYATAGQVSSDRVGQYLNRLSPMIEDGEVTSLVLIATDVTALEEQRLVLQVALDATGLGFWTFKPSDNTGTWDPTMHRILGFARR